MSQYVYATLPKEGSLMVVIMYINVIQSVVSTM